MKNESILPVIMDVTDKEQVMVFGFPTKNERA